jgi:hypothetical protein
MKSPSSGGHGCKVPLSNQMLKTLDYVHSLSFVVTIHTNTSTVTKMLNNLVSVHNPVFLTTVAYVDFAAVTP